MILALSRLPARRLFGNRRAFVALGGWSLASLGLALWSAHGGAQTSATNALLGVYASFALPLVTFALTGAIARGDKLQAAARSLTRVGASGPQAVVAHVAVAIVACVVVGSILGMGVAALAHGKEDPSIAADIVTCAWVGALAGGAYGGVFSLGSCFGPRGAGRSAVLVANWLVGGGILGSLLPLAHVRSLLGGDPAGALSQRGSAFALLAIALTSALLCAWRGRKPL